MTIRPRSRAPLGVAIAALIAGAPPSSARTFKYFGWTTETAECGAPAFVADDTPAQEGNVEHWGDHMAVHGQTDAGHLIDNNINLDRFCDPDSSVSSCSDSSNGIDEGDAVMIGIHGMDNGDHWEGLLRDSGTSGTSCTCNSQDDFRAGDAFVEFVHLNSCHSMDDDNLVGSTSLMEDPADSPSNGNRAQLLTGFHGDAASSSTYNGRYEDLAHDGFSIAVDDAWMDEMYHSTVVYWGVWGIFEQCPVTLSIGSSAADCTDRLTAQYDAPDTDPSSSAFICGSFIEDCTPFDDDPFTPPS